MSAEATEILRAPDEVVQDTRTDEPEVDLSALFGAHSLAWRCQYSQPPGAIEPGLLIDGDRFDAKAVPYLIDFYDEPPHPDEVMVKGAQLGVTAAAVIRTIDFMRAGIYPRGVLYGLPTQDEVYDFSQARFGKMIADNPDFFLGAVRDTNRTELKQIGTGMLYFRGIRQADPSKRNTKLLSIPVDCLTLDEYNDMDPAALALVMSRLDSSKIRHLLRFGHPSVPGFGVSELEEDSNQLRWMVKCKGCNSYTNPCESFPHCLGRVADGDWFLCCTKCRRQIFIIDGQWVAKRPDVKHRRGRLLSQLLSTRKPMNVIVAQYLKAMRSGEGLDTFWNMVMARAYVDLSDQLDIEFVRSLFNQDEPQQLEHYGPSFLGADVGVRKMYVQIGHHPENSDRSRYHWVGELEKFDELHDLAKRHNVQCGVIDSQAETRSVMDFCGREHWAWGALYGELHDSEPIWDPASRRVTIPRTPSLSGSHQRILNRRVEWPRKNAYLNDVVAPQLVNLAKVKIESALTKKTGAIRYAWHVVGTKNDHHRHAVNYAEVAATQVGMAMKPDPRRGARMHAQSWQAA